MLNFQVPEKWWTKIGFFPSKMYLEVKDYIKDNFILITLIKYFLHIS